MPFPNPDTQFKPGHPGGPGRPSAKPLTERLLAALESDKLGERVMPEGRKVADMVVVGWIEAAMRGETGPLKELLDRCEGKVGQPVELRTWQAPGAPTMPPDTAAAVRAAAAPKDADESSDDDPGADPGGGPAHPAG